MERSRRWGVRGGVVCAMLFVMGLAMALGATSASAQTFRGSILGTVTDTSGATVSGATVTVHNVDTGIDRSTETTTDGGYLVPELPIGTYDVVIEKSGFQKTVTTGVRVDVSVDRRVDAVLKAGAVTQQIVVKGETLPQLETTSDTLGGVFENKQVEDLPINGRDYTKLLIMVPGAAGEPNGGGDSPGSFGLFSANGNRGRANNFLLDGTDMNDGYRNLPAINQGGVFGTPGTVLPLDAIAEVNILSSAEPEYGRNSGSVVNIVTRSGTNNIHGTVYEDFRNAALNARNFFNTTDQPVNAFRNNQYGGALGGPIVRNKTFFFAAYEGQREGLAITSLNVVPSVTDFSNAYQAINPVTAVPCGPGTAIFACVQANSSLTNPVILNLFNLCNTTGGCSGGKNVWPVTSAAAAPIFNNIDSFIAKIDHSFNSNNQLSGRYFFGNSKQSFPLGLAGGNNLPNTNTVAPIRTQLLSLSWVHTISPTKVNEARFGWNRYRNGFFPADAGVFGNPETTLHLNTGVTNPRDFGLPTIRFFTESFLGSSPFSNPRNRVDTNWQGIDSFSWKLNKHDIRMGYEFHRTAVDSFNDFSARGVLVFNALEDFLKGTPVNTVLFSSRIITGITDRSAAQNSHALYVQDSYRFSNNVTLNFGLRWDYFGVIHEDQGRLSVFDPVLGLVHRDPLYNKDLNNFSPRASVAWDVFGKGKTVVRTGVGVYFDNFSQDAFTGQIYTNSFNAGLAYNAIGPNPVFVNKQLANPTIMPDQPVFQPGNNAATTDASTVQKNLETPYIYIYNLNIQQELFHNTVLQVGYVGSAGRKLLRLHDINQPTQQQIDQADIACACILDFSAPRKNTINLSPLAPNSVFVINQLESTATSNYNSLQISLNQRDWHRFNNQIAYTWAHSIDTASDSQDFVPNASIPADSTNIRGDRGPSNFDVRQRFVWSSVYEFPKWEALGRMGEGWALSGVLTIMSGHPFHLNYNGTDDYSGGGSGFDRPDLIAPVMYKYHDPSHFLDLSSFKIPCDYPIGGGDGFAGTCIPGSRHFGSLGRNALLGPNYRNFDFAVSKMTTLTERFKLQLRADFYNLTNHPNFANPLAVSFIADAAPNRTVANNSGVDPATGRNLGFLPLTATSDVGLGNPVLGGGGQRSIQFAAKFIF